LQLNIISLFAFYHPNIKKFNINKTTKVSDLPSGILALEIKIK